MRTFHLGRWVIGIRGELARDGYWAWTLKDRRERPVVAMTAEQERAAIVAWLRMRASKNRGVGHMRESELLERAAWSIEAGEHVKGGR